MSMRMQQMEMAHKNGSRSVVTLIPWNAPAPRPWGAAYRQVFIPYTDAEMRNRKAGSTRRGHVAVVHSKKLRPLPNTLTRHGGTLARMLAG